MGSEANASHCDDTDVTEDESVTRPSPGKSKLGKVPKRIHKAARERQKREHLNELFQDLAIALELNQQNSCKASILNEAARLLKDFFGQIESLKKDNQTLLSESQYVTIEKNELKAENSVMEEQIEKLRNELKARIAESTPDLNEPPPDTPQPELVPSVPVAEPPLQQTHTVFIIPLQPELPSFNVLPAQIGKPNPRYPTPEDGWPSQLLGRTTATRRTEPKPYDDSNDTTRERCHGRM
ncbi:hypothetical protein MLD38_039476 [Melastoma candidum]|uniref:Uncharacterized protein n=1 Tax=Melastoma candidum TaxID=119954 RepID=A0ACB9L3D4_9MYRT|nr:hypothetical protein MLD38_039476 [Melastoma candidum]